MKEVSFKIEPEQEKESDNFDLLFNHPRMPNVRTKDKISTNINHENVFLKSNYFYFVTAFFMLITACFLTVQIVVNSPDIEKYKIAVKDIEAETSESNPINSDVPDIQFAYSSPVKSESLVNIVKKQDIVVSKKAEINKIQVAKVVPKPLIKQIKRPVHIAVNNTKKITSIKRIQIVKMKPQTIIQKSPQLKINQAIVEIMLRPLTVVSNIDKKSAESILRGVH